MSEITDGHPVILHSLPGAGEETLGSSPETLRTESCEMRSIWRSGGVSDWSNVTRDTVPAVHSTLRILLGPLKCFFFSVFHVKHHGLWPETNPSRTRRSYRCLFPASSVLLAPREPLAQRFT
jgi:hypothetical protein